MGRTNARSLAIGCGALFAGCAGLGAIAGALGLTPDPPPPPPVTAARAVTEAPRAAPAAVAPPRATEPSAAPTPKWYAGGTLHKATAAEWRAGTAADRLATSADLLARMWDTGNLKPSMVAKLQEIDDLRPFAVELTAGLDSALGASETDPEKLKALDSLNVSTTAALLLVMMEWI